MLNSKTYMASIKRYVYTTNFRGRHLLDFQLLDLVAKPVKAVILLFPIRGKLDELRQKEEAKFKEEGQVPIDPTVFWIKQTVRLISVARLQRVI